MSHLADPPDASRPILDYGKSHYDSCSLESAGAGKAAVVNALIMAVVLVPLVWLTLGFPPMPFSPLFRVLSGNLFTDRVVPFEQNIFDRLTPFVIRDFFYYFAVIAVSTLLYVAAARWVCDRSTEDGHRVFAAATVAVCACLLILLTTPFFWLAQYTHSMGLTDARSFGLLCGIGSYAAIVGFGWWAIRKKRN